MHDVLEVIELEGALQDDVRLPQQVRESFVALDDLISAECLPKFFDFNVANFLVV